MCVDKNIVCKNVSLLQKAYIFQAILLGYQSVSQSINQSIATVIYCHILWANRRI